MRQNRSLSVLLWALLAHSLTLSVRALVLCNSTDECQNTLGAASECLSAGFCSNPFHRRGCLETLLPQEQLQRRRSFLRACNSDDQPDAEAKGICRMSPLDYTELRIATSNWESIIFAAWIMQIMLSELLDVPATVETGIREAESSFYDENLSLEPGGFIANVVSGFFTARDYKDCRKVMGSAEYVPCVHVLPEVWFKERTQAMQLYHLGVVEVPIGLGALGVEGWYIPRYVAARNPSLLSYLGLQGPQNRRTLAALFLRPTSWADYCRYESDDNCATPDNVAERAPQGAEADMYFFSGAFTGYFRNTTQNDCERWPNNCTGHIVDFPCEWSSAVRQQAFYLDIGVESNGPQLNSGGYSYDQMTQILEAADKARANVMLKWWTPQHLYQRYFGTHMELQRISLPPPTQECLDHQTSENRCSANLTAQIGDALGSCDEPPQVLAKGISTAVFDISFQHPDKALHSPAHELIKNFQISDLQYGEIFDIWHGHGVDIQHFDPRWAVCQWVVDNLEELEGFVPRTFPRVLQDETQLHGNPLHLASVAAAGVAMLLTILTSVATHRLRKKEAVRYAQIEFLWILLGGLFLVSMAALLTAIPPTDAVCVSLVWFSNFGYTLELVPLVLKIGAIYHIHVAAQQMRRIRLQKKDLFGAVFVISFVVGVTLMVWTIIDPPQKKREVQLTGATSADGEHTVIERSYYCGQDKEFWDLLGVGWQVFLLFCASILAFQTRKVRSDLNEARTLAMLIYSHFVFAIMRTLTFVVDLSESSLAGARSLIYTTDVIATIFIYFLPKFVATKPARPNAQVSGLDAVARRVSLVVARRFSRMIEHVDEEILQDGGSSKKLEPTLSDQQEELEAQQGLAAVDFEEQLSGPLSRIVETEVEESHVSSTASLNVSAAEESFSDEERNKDKGNPPISKPNEPLAEQLVGVNDASAVQSLVVEEAEPSSTFSLAEPGSALSHHTEAVPPAELYEAPSDTEANKNDAAVRPNSSD